MDAQEAEEQIREVLAQEIANGHRRTCHNTGCLNGILHDETKLLRCGGCTERKTCYCGRACQLAHWPQHKLECDKTLQKHRKKATLPGEVMMCDWKLWLYQLESNVLTAHIIQYISGYSSNTMKKDHAVVLKFRYCNQLPFNRKFQFLSGQFVPISEAQQSTTPQTISKGFMGASISPDWIRTKGPTAQYIRIPRLNHLELEDGTVLGCTTGGLVLERPVDSPVPSNMDMRQDPIFYEVTKIMLNEGLSPAEKSVKCDHSACIAARQAKQNAKR